MSDTIDPDAGDLSRRAAEAVTEGFADHVEDARQLECDRARAKTLEETIEKYRLLFAEGYAVPRRAEDRRAERITDESYAESMQEHRMQRVVTDSILQAFYQAVIKRKAGDQECHDKLVSWIGNYLEENGGLWWREGYEIEKERARIRNTSEFICVRAGARPFMEDGPEFGDFRFGAEMRTRIVQPGASTPVTAIPNPDLIHRDVYRLQGPLASCPGEFHASSVLQKIYRNPCVAAEIQDVYTYDKLLDRMRVASAARRETFRIAEEEENAERHLQDQIKIFIANTARLESIGINGGDGTDVIALPNGGAANWRSIRMHSMTQHEDYIGYLGWRLPSEPLIVRQFQPRHPETEEPLCSPIDITARIGWETVVLEHKSNFI